jgi:hypothetical protein
VVSSFNICSLSDGHLTTLCEFYSPAGACWPRSERVTCASTAAGAAPRLCAPSTTADRNDVDDECEDNTAIDMTTPTTAHQSAGQVSFEVAITQAH